MPEVRGLDVRDWFAGQALAGILMNPTTPTPGAAPLEIHAASLAEQAYAYADAMLKARENRAAGSPAQTQP